MLRRISIEVDKSVMKSYVLKSMQVNLYRQL